MHINQDNRHLRQTILPDIGEKGQSELRNSSVLVIGAGGLGSPVLYYLAAAGVGTLHILDSDIVSNSNLNRQILFSESDIGYPKAERACMRLRELDSSLNLIPHVKRADHENIAYLCKGMDVVVDCVDNTQTRYIVNHSAVSLDIPLVEAGIYAFDGYVFPILPRQSACYACMDPNADKRPMTPNPVLGATAGVIGAMQAGIAIRILVDLPVPAGIKHIFSLVDLSKTVIHVTRNPNCPVCGKQAEAEKISAESV